MLASRSPPPRLQYVYLNQYEYNDYLRIKNAALPGLQTDLTQQMKQVMKKIEGVDDRLIWTDSMGALAQEQTWRAESIRGLPRHQPELPEAADTAGKNQTTLVKTSVKTRLGDVLNYASSYYMPSQGVDRFKAITAHTRGYESGVGKVFGEEGTVSTSSAKKVQPGGH